MSDNIPFEIQVEIIKYLPVKSLLQFRSVSKTWKSMIDSSAFIAGYSCQQQHILVSYDSQVDLDQKYVSIVVDDDDDSLPQQHRVSPTLPRLVKWLKRSRIIGSSHGLLCFYSRRRYVDVAVIWNVSIRKAVGVGVPYVEVPRSRYETVLGFGVCRETNDPKIVKITQFSSWDDMETISAIRWQVEVFPLSTPVWRIAMRNLPRKSIRFGYFKVAIDGVLYWLAADRITMDDRYRLNNLIVSFDMTSEEFREITLPESLANQLYYNLSIFMRRESLVVLERDVEFEKSVFYVWMMEDGVPNSFTKLFTVNVHTPDATIHGFKKSGEPIIEITQDLGSNEMQALFSVYPYMESLLLLDQPDSVIYDKGKRHIIRWRSLRNANKV